MAPGPRPFILGRPKWRWVAAATLALASALFALRYEAYSEPRVAGSFATLVQRLSEPGGDFDTDNLISNEKSYLHVVPALKAGGVTGGVYIGVGPDQNFSYIAQIRPELAFILDVRRDNLLLHLLFKAIFARARTRIEYLCVLTGRPLPEHLESWREASIDKIVDYLDNTKADPDTMQSRQKSLDETIKGFGVPVASADLSTIDRFHRAFETSGLALRFESRGRPPRTYYPTYRELLTETDRNGQRCSFVASERDFQFIRSLEADDRIVPVVGDVSGPHALRTIADVMIEGHEQLSAFYISNVEMYVFRDGGFPKFVDNVSRLPRDRRSVMIRSVFDGYRLPESVPGYYSTSVLQTVDSLVSGYTAGHYRTYWDLVKGQ